MISVTVDAVLTGRAVPFGPKGEPSAMAKTERAGPVAVTWLGLEGDEQGDPSVHGGLDMAIHHYPHDHYAWWREAFPDLPLLDTPGAFGENISTSGLTEDDVCIGDRWRLGSALVEVSQGRQPCWKLNHRFGDPRILAVIVRTGLSGWYWRIIQEGKVAAGDELMLVDRPCPQWSVARVFGMVIRGDDRRERGAYADLSRVDQLTEGWRQRAAKFADA